MKCSVDQSRLWTINDYAGVWSSFWTASWWSACPSFSRYVLTTVTKWLHVWLTDWLHLECWMCSFCRNLWLNLQTLQTVTCVCVFCTMCVLFLSSLKEYIHRTTSACWLLNSYMKVAVCTEQCDLNYRLFKVSVSVQVLLAIFQFSCLVASSTEAWKPSHSVAITRCVLYAELVCVIIARKVTKYTFHITDS